jgi:nitroimidazol reductase NimA-like FMN-containing flavoprotein (pyridoxamine 5'-phosphate oxidase superfamily)
MVTNTPSTDLDGRYGEPRAVATPWSRAEEILARAEVFWLTTVRPDGRPHVTPLISVWHGGGLHISTGPQERKARNLSANPSVALTTGSNALHGGLDLVVEGIARLVEDDAELRRLAYAWEAKYGPDWHYDVADGRFVQGGNAGVLVYRVEPTTAFGFGKDPYSQTLWRFGG